MKFNIWGALFAIFMDIVGIIVKIINILTWGKVGRMWMVNITLWELSLNISVYKESPNEQ